MNDPFDSFVFHCDHNVKESDLKADRILFMSDTLSFLDSTKSTHNETITFVPGVSFVLGQRLGAVNHLSPT
jgi:hypothetical protein